MVAKAVKDGLLMVLDAGGGGGRCLLIDTSGREVSFAYRPWTMKVPQDHPMGSVFDPEEWWPALVDAAREALAKAGVDGHEAGGAGPGDGAVGPGAGAEEPGAGAAGPGDGAVGPGAGTAGRKVLAVSTTSIRDAAVFLDAGGNELYCGTNRDGRGLEFGFEVAQTLGETQWRITGRWPLGLDPAARLLWYRRYQPDVFDRIRHVLSINTWLTYRLSGAVTIEPTGASSSGLFDVDRGEWSDELTKAHGFDPSIFPPVSWPGQVAGRLSSATAGQLGLEPGIPVVTGLADSQAGCLGSAAWEPGDAVVVAGTTAPVMQVTDIPFRDPTHHIWAGAYAAPGRWVIESNAGLAGAVYAWYASTFVPAAELGGEGGQQGAGASPDPGAGTGHRSRYEVLEAEIAAAPPGQILAWLGPNVANFSSLSFPMEAQIKFPALGVFCTPTRGALARAVFENIAYAVRGNVEQLPARPELVRLCGGLARSRAFAQILAATLNVPLAVPAVREATGAGAAVAAAVGAGAYPDLASAVEGMVTLAETFVPDAILAGQYEGQYAAWRAGVAV